MDKGQLIKGKVQELIQRCQDELAKTTTIGKKMLSASKINGSLHDSYEMLGRLAADQMRDKKLDWQDIEANKLFDTINCCEKQLEELEAEMSNIRSGVHD